MDPGADLVREPPLNGNTAGDESEVSPLTTLKEDSSFGLYCHSQGSIENAICAEAGKYGEISLFKNDASPH